MFTQILAMITDILPAACLSDLPEVKIIPSRRSDMKEFLKAGENSFDE